MSDINPASKSTQPAQEHAPYLCTCCGQPANDIMCTVVNGLAVFWHGGCKGILGLQMMQQLREPRQQSSIIVPGRPQ